MSHQSRKKHHKNDDNQVRVSIIVQGLRKFDLEFFDDSQTADESNNYAVIRMIMWNEIVNRDVFSLL